MNQALEGKDVTPEQQKVIEANRAKMANMMKIKAQGAPAPKNHPG